MFLPGLRPILLALWLAAPLPAAAADVLAPPQAGVASEGIAAAFDALRAGSYIDALEAAGRAGPVGRDVIEWLRLRDGRGTFAETLAFLGRRPDWPGLALLRATNEDTLPRPRDRAAAAAVIAYFAGTRPATGQGVIALVEAHRHLGSVSDAEAEAALAWVTRPLGPQGERVLLALFPGALKALDDERMEAMFWAGADDALRRAAARRSGSDAAALAGRRLLARAGRSGSAPYDDGGVAHERFRRLVGSDRKAAVTLLLAQSASAETLGNPMAWASARHDLARRLLDEGAIDRAYRVAASHWLTTGSVFAELEWLAGYLSLNYRNEPRTALLHFARFRDAVETPISLGRAGYWLGRAYEALDEPDAARDAYLTGAEHQTSFYGLLSAERAGLPLDPGLAGTEDFPPLVESGLRHSTVLEAGLLLQAAGERDLAELFLTHLADERPREEIGTLGDVVLALGEPHLALRIAKRAAARGMTLPRAYFPVVELGVEDLPVPEELALAIARRESEFDPGVASGVGARGLMQLMPGAARDMARSLGLPYSPARLFSDPSYNATLGTAYLAGLVRRFGPNPVLVAAGYNAGPGRPLQWMRTHGDPRSGDVDPVDWIERIPFEETRNYVMRVAESLPVYRARLTGTSGPVTLSNELAAR